MRKSQINAIRVRQVDADCVDPGVNLAMALGRSGLPSLPFGAGGTDHAGAGAATSR